jgi:hypothetical protein
MSPLHTWLTIGPLALVCYGAAVLAVCRALGSRSTDYPRPPRSNRARSVGAHNNLRKVRP